jgi:photosystem II stability/assembly factor-like uncharacterized protein
MAFDHVPDRHTRTLEAARASVIRGYPQRASYMPRSLHLGDRVSLAEMPIGFPSRARGCSFAVVGLLALALVGRASAMAGAPSEQLVLVGRSVRAGTSATSVSFLSPLAGFVLGTAACRHTPCTAVLGTLDGGRSWHGLSAPAEAVSVPFGSGLWGMRFADPQRGYAYGHGLWSTLDGGSSWQRSPAPGRFVVDLAAVQDRELVAVTANCAFGNSGCSDELTLYHRPLAGGAWQRIANSGRFAFDESLAVHANAIWVLAGVRLFVSTDGGRTFRSHSEPCPPKFAPFPEPAAITDDGPHTYLLCAGLGFTGRTPKFIYRTTDTARRWTEVGRPPAPGDAGELAAGSDSTLVTATAGASSWLYRSHDAGRHWNTALTYGDGAEGWVDLAFSTPTNGAVIYGPAHTDGGSPNRPGRLLLTRDGGATWRVTRF